MEGAATGSASAGLAAFLILAMTDPLVTSESIFKVVAMVIISISCALNILRAYCYKYHDTNVWMTLVIKC